MLRCNSKVDKSVSHLCRAWNHRQTLSGQTRPREPEAVRQPFKLAQRLTDEIIEQLVADYQAGASAQIVARLHGIGKGSAIRLLSERGVLRPRRLPTDELIAEAALLYATGLSLEAVGERIDLDKSVICREFKTRGVQTRKPWERSQAASS
jgi:hypothetical protein